MNALPILAFELLSPAMLGWLAAAAAPILIHLWSRRRYREMSWAAMEYLLAALRRSRRRINLEQLLLLLVRVFLIVLLVLAVAEPVLRTGGFASAPGERTHRVIVIDGSFSMAYQPTDKSRFERAKETAARIVEASPQGDGFTLVLLSDPPRVVVGTPAFEARNFLREIENLELPHTSADLPGTLAAVERVVQAARREAPRLTREAIYFLTDLGRVGWGLERLDAAAKAEFQKRSRRLAESATLVVLDLGQADAENTAVTAIRSSEPLATPYQDFQVEAELKHFGGHPPSKLAVELLADGRTAKQETLDLSRGQGTARFSYRFETPGDHVLEVRAVGDRLDVDNHRWLAVPVKASIPVLCVDGRPSGDASRGAAGYLAAALSPRQDRQGRALVHPQIRPENALSEVSLNPYDCVFLSNVAQFTANEAKILEAYLKQGGSVVFFLGDQVRADSYNRQLGGDEPGAPRLLPARLGPILPAEGRLDPLDYHHPIVRPFQGQENAGLLTTPVRKYFKLLLPKQSKAQVALALAGGDPLIVEEEIHRGRVFLVATAADTAAANPGETPWTWLPVWPSFVPIVQEILAYAESGQLQQRSVLVGEPLGGTFPPSAGEVPFTLRLPGGRSEAGRSRVEGDAGVWSYADTTRSGVYTAEFGPPISRSEAFAVNVDPLESDLAKITSDQLRDDVWPGTPFLYQTTWQNLETRPGTVPGRPSPLTKGLLYAVLGLLLVETYLARRFGHYAP